MSKTFLRNYGLGLVLLALFLISWAGQFATQLCEVISENAQHGERMTVAETLAGAEFWAKFFSATFENWQSEFLQLLAFVVLTKFLYFKGSHESKPVGTPPGETV